VVENYTIQIELEK